ncbi:MAG: hypothetical protein LAT51_02390 [Flavobacteriaceae bacterium]|nr:hypothetical protein [Flavobacteriaceae bacterium]
MKRFFKFFLIALLFFGVCSFIMHKFYVSVTNFEYREDLKSVQIISKVFADDFEDILKLRYQEEVILSPESETANADRLIEKYIYAKFKLQLDDEKQKLTYIGKKYVHDQIHFFVEVNDVEDFNKVEISNLILTDLFDDQKNLIHFKKDGKTKSAIIVKSDPKALLKFN